LVGGSASWKSSRVSSTVGPVPPAHIGAARGDVVAVLGGDGNEAFRLHADGFEEGAVFRLDLVETRLRVILQIHLVDKHGDLADAQEIEQVAVAARLFLHALVGVDQQQGRLGVGRAGDHVLEKLLVAGSVNNNVLAFFCAKPDLRGVNGDVLVALGLEGVHEVGPFEGHAAALGHGLQLFQFAFGQRAGVVKEPADKRGFAMVNVADDDDFELFHGQCVVHGWWIKSSQTHLKMHKRGFWG
jgi:hypothetical protein